MRRGSTTASSLIGKDEPAHSKFKNPGACAFSAPKNPPYCRKSDGTATTECDEARSIIDEYAKWALGPGEPMRRLPAFFYKLPLRAQRCYLKSDAIASFEGFAPSLEAKRRLADLQRALESGT